MNSLYQPLNCPELNPTALKRGLEVQTRIFYADSVPGNKAKVVRFWETPKGWFVRLNYGKNEAKMQEKLIFGRGSVRLRRAHHG